MLYFNSSQTNPVFLAFLLLLGHCPLQSGIQLRARTYKVVGHSISNVTNTQTEFVCVTQVIYIVQLFGGFLISFYLFKRIAASIIELIVKLLKIQSLTPSYYQLIKLILSQHQSALFQKKS